MKSSMLVPPLSGQGPEIPYAGEVPLVPNVRPVMVLKAVVPPKNWTRFRRLLMIRRVVALPAA